MGTSHVEHIVTVGIDFYTEESPGNNGLSGGHWPQSREIKLHSHYYVNIQIMIVMNPLMFPAIK